LPVIAGLEALLTESTDRAPSAIRDRILEAVARHCGTRPADDDRTVMILRFDNFHHGYNQKAVPVLEEVTV
jgi:serine phosphatase RsbU (regulator of sigma subunit)